MKIKFKITEKLDGQRLDYAVAFYTKSCSRSYAAHLIKNKKILVSGTSKKPSYKIKYGEIITGKISIKNHIPIYAQPININILYQDSHIVIINKQSGMVVHPSISGHHSGTLINALIHHIPELKNIGKNQLRAGIVHRLDKDTSGVMVVAKNNSSLYFLQKEFKERRVKKNYLAFVTGCVKQDKGKIILPIGRDLVKRKIMSVNNPNGKYAETIFKVKKRFNGTSLVEAIPKTGRTHQIRVHFRALGHPVIGDKVYGFKIKKKRKDFTALIEKQTLRQMLHAWKLSFRHPWSGKRICFKAIIPNDFRKIIPDLMSL